MKNLLVIAMIATITGCATVPRSKLAWTSGDYSISVQRKGCELNNIQVKNNGTEVAKVFGTIDILDKDSNTVSTVKFGCDNAHPGGSATCMKSQTYNEASLLEMPGFYCAVFHSCSQSD